VHTKFIHAQSFPHLETGHRYLTTELFCEPSDSLIKLIDTKSFERSGRPGKETQRKGVLTGQSFVIERDLCLIYLRTGTVDA
jgi:hypothetical protein